MGGGRGGLMGGGRGVHSDGPSQLVLRGFDHH